MDRITAGDQAYRYERLARNRAKTVFEAVIVAESRSGEVSVRHHELDAATRSDLGPETIESELERWQNDHPHLTVQRFVVRETNTCGAGKFAGEVGEDGSVESEPADASAEGETATVYRGGTAVPRSIEFGDVPVTEGEEVEYHVGGPSNSVYGTDSGTVAGVKTGTEDYHVLILETESGTKRIPENWLVDGSDPDDAA